MVSKLSNLLDQGQVERQFSYLGDSGLDVTIDDGIFVRANTVNNIVGATITLADDDVSLVYIDTNTLLVTSAIAVPAEDFVPLYEITTASGVVTVVSEMRVPSRGILDS